MRALIEQLCSPELAGRATGSPGGRAAARLIEDELRRNGLEVTRQPVTGCDGINLLATSPGKGALAQRWVLVAAHYDHLGQHGSQFYPGADDNAAAVGALVTLARGLAHTPQEGRSVLLCVFDAEEPPHFRTPEMGSEHWCRNPTVPVEAIDLMVCMDLVGHAVGPEGMPPALRQSLFALGAEKSEGTAARVDAMSTAVPGVVVRRADAQVVPKLSDYAAFWERKVPFVFLTCGRWVHYHTPQDTPDRLDWPKLAATAAWLERLTRDACARPEARVRFTGFTDDRSTLTSTVDVLKLVAATGMPVNAALRQAEGLLAQCDANGRSPDPDAVMTLFRSLETQLG